MATGCCTSPAGSRSPDGAPSSTCRTNGPGSQSSRQRSIASKRSQPQPADTSHRPTQHHQAAVRPRPRSRLPVYRENRRPRLRGTAPNLTTTPNNTTTTTLRPPSACPRVPLTRLLHVRGLVRLRRSRLMGRGLASHACAEAETRRRRSRAACGTTAPGDCSPVPGSNLRAADRSSISPATRLGAAMPAADRPSELLWASAGNGHRVTDRRP